MQWRSWPSTVSTYGPPGGVFDQDYLASANHAALAVAGRHPIPSVEIDDVLTAGRCVPIEIVGRRDLAEGDAGGGQLRRQLSTAPP